MSEPDLTGDITAQHGSYGKILYLAVVSDGCTDCELVAEREWEHMPIYRKVFWTECAYEVIKVFRERGVHPS